VIIYYNSTILSRLLTNYEASGNAKALALLKQLSPAAWRHIHLNGHCTFRGGGQASIWMPSWRSWRWGDGIFGGLGLRPR
jgi:hypothetical protein